MDQSDTILLRDARLADGRMKDLVVTAGVVTCVVDAGSAVPIAAAGEVDLGGQLVLPAPAEPHAHLDKALLAERFPYRGGDLAASIAQVREAYIHLDEGDILDRARRAVRDALGHGCTAIRTHADCGDDIGLRSVRALLALRDELRGTVDLTVTALPNPLVTGAAGRENRAALERSVELGVDSVGGCPTLDANPAQAVDWYVRIAAEAGLPLDLHVDETLDPHCDVLGLLARRVLDTEFPHRVSASHCVSLGARSATERGETIELVRSAGIAVVVCPQTNLLLQGRGEIPGSRGMAPIGLLRRRGVLVAGGGDNWRDPFNPLGRIDALETAQLLVAAAHLSPDDAYAAVSVDARAVLGLGACGPEVGLAADLIAVAVRDVSEFVAAGSADRLVIRAGRVVGRTQTRSWTAVDA